MITGVSVGTTESSKLIPIGPGEVVTMSTGGFTPTPGPIAGSTGMLATGKTPSTDSGLVTLSSSYTDKSGLTEKVTTAAATDKETADKIAAEKAASDTKKSIATTVADKAAEVVKKDWVKPVAIVALLFVALFTGYKLFVGSKAVAA